jgi:Flp pilus assembly protein TadG
MSQRGLMHPGGRTGGRAGSTSLEVAICLPVLLMMAFGMIEFGRMLVLEHSMTWASTTTIRYAVVHGSTSQAPTITASCPWSPIVSITGLTGSTLTSTLSGTIQY